MYYNFKKTNNYIYLLFILIIATLVRLFLLDKPFCANDVALFQQFSLDSLPLEGINSFFNIDNFGIGNPLRVFVFLYSITYPIFWLMIISLYNFIGIPFTDLTWRIPILLVGVLSIVVIYLFLQKFLSKKQSLISAAFFSIFPLHVAWSRSIANTMLFSLSIQLLALYFFINYLENNNKNSLLISSIFIALFILSDNFFPQFLILIIFVFIVYNRNAFFSNKRRKNIYLNIFNWRMFLFPSLALFLQLLIFIIIYSLNFSGIGFNAGMLGHILAKPKYLGLHLFLIIELFWELINPLLFTFIVIMIILGIKSFFKFEKVSILLFGGLIYVLPFIFFMDPTKVNVKVYLFTSIVFFILFAFVIFFNLNLNKNIRNCVLMLLFLVTFLSLFPKVYGIPEADENFINYGSNMNDCGIKALAYWVRINTDADLNIMTKYDSTRIGPPNGKYYLHRKIYAVFGPMNWNDFFIENFNKVDAVLLTPEDKFEINFILNNGFSLAYDFIYNEKQFLLFMKGNYVSQKLDISKYSHLYDKTFNKLENYLESPNYVADSPAWV